MNVLVILSSGHNPKFMGCAGHAVARTPNLDALAAHGTRFTAAYTPSPLCAPARAAFAAGRRVQDIGFGDGAIADDGRMPGWAQRLRAAGIRVESLGKPDDPDADPDNIRHDRGVTNAACQWLAEAGKQPGAPWCLCLGYCAPHFPLAVPEPYLEDYPLESIPPPKLHPADGHARHAWIEDYDAGTRIEWDWSDAQRGVAAAHYLGLVSFVDEQVGELLAALDEGGLAERTLVLYSSDHGDNAGARGLWGASTLYEESAGIPMILAGPEMPHGGTVRTAVSLLDCHPTLLEAFGVEPEADLPGSSLLSLAADAYDPWRAVLCECHGAGAPSGAFLLRRGRCKYHYYVGYAPELFDMETDPEETRDLAGLPEYGALLAEHEALLRAICDPEEVDRRNK